MAWSLVVAIADSIRPRAIAAKPARMTATMPADASALYARNLMHFVNLMLDPKTGELKIDRSDEIIAGTMVCCEGAAVRS